MRTPGLIRKMDELGRVVVPAQLRSRMDLNPGDELEMYMENDVLILRKFSPACIFCGDSRELMTYAGKNICGNCIRTIKEA